MEIMRRDSMNMSGSYENTQRRKFAENRAASQEFERIESLETSYEVPNIKEPKDKNSTLTSLAKANSMREETYLEKFRNLGTNLRFNFESLGQGGLLETNKNACFYLLGDKYEVSREDPDKYEKSKDFMARFSNIIWFSYRKNFPKLIHKKLPVTESFISDTGWGCMIRVCQMMFAECLKRCYNTKQIRESQVSNYVELDQRLLNIKIVSWFLDSEIDPKVAPYSIQNISSYIYDKFEKKPGVWLKPSMVLFALQRIHKDYSQYTFCDMDLEIYLEGTIYLHQTIKKMTSQRVSEDDPEPMLEKEFEVIEGADEEDHSKILSHKGTKASSRMKESRIRKASIEGQAFEAFVAEDPKDLERLFNLKWKKSLMIILLAKIGIDKPNSEYFPFIKELLSFPESIGMIAIGGKPGLAYYIVGYNKDKLIYLDPHFVQESVRSKQELELDFSSYSCDKIRHIGFNDIDTSVAFGFFIQDETSFREFIFRFEQASHQEEAFLGVELSMMREDSGDFESVGEEDEDFEMIFVK